MNIIDMQSLISYTIENNKKLATKRKSPIAINVIGESGIGKTDAIRQVCSNLNMQFIEIDLSGREDVGDLLGLPIEKFEMCIPGSTVCEWIPSTLIPYYQSKGYLFTGKNRMEYSIPKTMMIESNDPIVFYADDYNRSTASILQAMMTLMKDGKINNWELPKGSTVITSSNPDDGEYHVQSVDDAHSTRSLDIEVDFDFSTWLDNYGLKNVDDRGVSFLVNYKEELERKKFKDVNIRLWSMFFDQISGIKDWDTNLSLILNIMSKKQFKGYVELFIQFISSRMDKIPTLKDLFSNDWESVKKELIVICKDRLDVVTIIKEKLVSFGTILKKDDVNFKEKCDRLNQFISLTEVFPNDLLWNIVVKLSNNTDIPLEVYDECFDRLRRLKNKK